MRHGGASEDEGGRAYSDSGTVVSMAAETGFESSKESAEFNLLTFHLFRTHGRVPAETEWI